MSTTVVPGKTSPISRKTLVLAGTAIAVVALAVAGVRWWTVGRFIESTDDAYVRADVVTLSSHVPGYVARSRSKTTRRCRPGDVLAHIDERDYRRK